METLDTDGPVRLIATGEASDGFVALLESALWGTDGALYRTREVRHEIERLRGSGTRFLELWDGEALVGTYGMVPRTVAAPGGPLTAFYRGALVVHPDHLGRGHGRRLVEGARRRFLDEGGGRRALFGYIDVENARSLHLSLKAGYTPLATLEVAVFSRLSPRDDARVGPADDLEEVRGLWRARAGAHTFFDHGGAARPGEVLVLRDGGRIRATAQLLPRHYAFERLPGIGGFLALRVGPYVPGLARLFPARAWRHLWVTGLWGEAKDLITLLEAALARHRLTSAMLYLDPRDDTHAALLEAPLGPLHRLGLGGRVHVTAAFRGVPEEEVAHMRAQPFWVSGWDAF